jgi:hypothetical protein
MVPNVSQQLAAIRHTIEKTIMPSLDPQASFAQEQAGLILASLDWALDVLQSEHRYEEVEHAEYRDLLGSLQALASNGAGGDLPPAEPPADLASLRAATIDLKRRSQSAFEELVAQPDSPAAAEARKLLGAVAERQSARERAWARMTGFPGASEPIADVLREQAAA